MSTLSKVIHEIKESCGESFYPLRECPSTMNRMLVEIWVNSNGHPDEVSDRNEEYVIGQWRKGDPCYDVAKTKQ